jgi:mRNA interferase RelE/StbE
MSYRVELTTAAARQIRKLPRPARDRVLDAIEHLADDPRPHLNPSHRRNTSGEEWVCRQGSTRNSSGSSS